MVSNLSQLLEPQSDLTVTLIAVAVRIGHKMGLHRTGSDPHMPFFEQEMRLRVWWQIMGMERRARRKLVGLSSPIADYGDLRMPLNVNDADLHPDMTGRPAIEHTGATEMLYCMIKYEVPNYARSWLATAADTKVDPYALVSSTALENESKKRQVLADLERIYEGKYLCHCDESIPLHHVTATVTRLTIHCERFRAYHPRNQSDGGRHMAQADLDIVFESSIQMLQLYHDVRQTTFSAHLLAPNQGPSEIEALVFMISELQQRVSGDMARTAWKIMERMYQDLPQLLQKDNGFYTALGDLTLKAWEARRQEEVQSDAAPDCIGLLREMRSKVDSVSTAITGDIPQGVDFQFALIHDDPLDWMYWDTLAPP
jgi:hypothetical protein